MTKARILVIDDEEIVRVCCKRALMDEGYEVDVTASGKEGLELFDRRKYDLVVLDLKMPHMEGIEVLANIKRGNPDQKVIMITGYMALEHADESSMLGATRYLEKPFAPDVLLSAINTMLRGWFGKSEHTYR
jgi:DNA-binding NtrC family response regulator